MNMVEYLQSYLESRKNSPAQNENELPTLEDLRREYIRYLLEVTFHNISLTAKILNVSRTTLYNALLKPLRRPF
jgi:transcriptional regulator with PAS, ATPase and Fis domain